MISSSAWLFQPNLNQTKNRRFFLFTLFLHNIHLFCFHLHLLAPRFFVILLRLLLQLFTTTHHYTRLWTWPDLPPRFCNGFQIIFLPKKKIENTAAIHLLSIAKPEIARADVNFLKRRFMDACRQLEVLQSTVVFGFKLSWNGWLGWMIRRKEEGCWSQAQAVER